MHLENIVAASASDNITTQETGILSQNHDFVWRRDTNKDSAKTLSLF